MAGFSVDDKWPTLVVDINTNLNNSSKVPDAERLVLSTILWSNQQNDLLQNDPPKIITSSDFGSGKLYVCTGRLI